MAVQKNETLSVSSKDRKDTIEKDFLGFPDTASDALNALLYGGKDIISPESLLPAPTETFYQGFDKIHSQYEDLAKYVMQEYGRIKCMYLLSNQSRPDGKMPLRKSGYIGGAYREQYNGKIRDVYPVVQVIFNWGRRKWPRRRRLKELFRKNEFTEEEWAYIDDQELLVFDMRHLPKEIRERFRSDLRIVVDYLAGEDIRELGQRIMHKRELVKMLSVLSNEANVDDIEAKLDVIEKKQENTETGKENENMAGLFTQYLDMGRAEGKIEGRAETILNNIDNLIKNLNLSLEEACDAAGITVRNYEEAKELLNGVNS